MLLYSLRIVIIDCCGLVVWGWGLECVEIGEYISFFVFGFFWVLNLCCVSSGFIIFVFVFNFSYCSKIVKNFRMCVFEDCWM